MDADMSHANVTNILEGLQAGTATVYTVTVKRVKNK